MGRPRKLPLHAFAPELAAKVKWARYSAPTSQPPQMTRDEALANMYEELVDALNYLDIAINTEPALSELRPSVEQLAMRVRELLPHEQQVVE